MALTKQCNMVLLCLKKCLIRYSKLFGHLKALQCRDWFKFSNTIYITMFKICVGNNIRIGLKLQHGLLSLYTCVWRIYCFVAFENGITLKFYVKKPSNKPTHFKCVDFVQPLRQLQSFGWFFLSQFFPSPHLPHL